MSDEDCYEADGEGDGEELDVWEDDSVYLRKTIYAAWRHANGRAVVQDIHNTQRRAGPLPKVKT